MEKYVRYYKKRNEGELLDHREAILFQLMDRSSVLAENFENQMDFLSDKDYPFPLNEYEARIVEKIQLVSDLLYEIYSDLGNAWDDAREDVKNYERTKPD